MSANDNEVRLGSSFWREGVEKCQLRLCVEAIGMFEQAVLLQPTNPELHYRLGVCYGGGCRRHSLTEPDVAVEHLRHALPLASDSGDDLLRATILDALGNTYLHSRGLPAEDRLKAAIGCFQVAALEPGPTR